MGPGRIGQSVALAAAAALAASFPAPASAQDSHYWTNQYGTRAELLGGTVVGSIKDLSCVYYNPGAMALVDKPELVLTTDAFQIEAIDVDTYSDVIGTATSTESGKAPSIFAIRIDGIDPLGTQGIALSILTRQQFNADLDWVRITPAGQPLPDTGYLSVEGNFSQRLYESWFGATLARKYGRFGVGGTLFGVYRSQSRRSQLIAASAGGPDGGSSAIGVDSYSFWQIRLLVKIGVAWERTDFTFGLALTTPGLGVMSSAKLLSTLSDVNVDPGTGSPADELVANYQEGLSADVRSPLSLAVGGSWRITGTSTIHATMEYFRKIDAYTVIEGAPYTGQTTGVEITNTVTSTSRSVFNWGFGYEERLSAGVSLYGGFWVDRSTNDQPSDSDLTVTNWDIYHVTAGSNFQVRTIRITLGVSYARGTAPVEREIDFEKVGGDRQVVHNSNVLYRRLKGIIGLSFEV